jgi:hypothetical protein
MFFLLAIPALVMAQIPAPPATGSQNCATCPPADDSQFPALDSFIEPVRGVNAGLTVSGVHDSATGWATLAIPFISYSFSDIFSADASIPVYMYRLAAGRSTYPMPAEALITKRGELGDIIVGLHAQFIPAFAQYRITAALSAPTGDQSYGISTGRVTFDLNNHFERTYRRLTPKLEIGAGDSSALVDRIVTKHYTSLGPLAHFQVGFIVDLIHGTSFSSDAYEQLPIGDQKVYGYSRRRKATVVTGLNVTEDNGFINSLDIPINRHTTLSGYYSHSLRLRTDTSSIGITYILRAPTEVDDLSLDELFQ